MANLAKPLRPKDRTNVFGYLVAIDAGHGYMLFLTVIDHDAVFDVDWRDDQTDAIIFRDYDRAVKLAAEKDPRWNTKPKIIELIGRVV